VRQPLPVQYQRPGRHAGTRAGGLRRAGNLPGRLQRHYPRRAPGRPEHPRLGKTGTTVWCHAMKLILLLNGLFSLPALAVVDRHKYQFDDELRNKRFAPLAEDLRCPKCQNQNLAESDAPVAADMRDKIYEMMQAGASDTEIVA